MNSAPFELALLDGQHDRAAFNSDSESLNRYIQTQASQDTHCRVAVMVDAKDDAASAFYQHHGFIALPDSPLTLFLPLATVRPASK